MGSASAPVILISAVLLLSIISTASAFNITILLSRYPGFEMFNDMLTRTRISAEINRRRTITVLALSNDHIGDLASKAEDVQRRILSNHVVLDYYDSAKLNKLKDTKTMLTTLYQSSGVADDQQGFLVVVHRKDGSIVFGSAVKGSPLESRLESAVAAQPYNISVLSVSQAIVAPGIDGAWKPMPDIPPTKAPAPHSPPPAESPEEQVPAEAPAPEADAPVADAPGPSPSGAPAPGPVADAPAADEADNAKEKNAAGKQAVSGVYLGLVVVLASFLAAQ